MAIDLDGANIDPDLKPILSDMLSRMDSGDEAYRTVVQAVKDIEARVTALEESAGASEPNPQPDPEPPLALDRDARLAAIMLDAQRYHEGFTQWVPPAYDESQVEIIDGFSGETGGNHNSPIINRVYRNCNFTKFRANILQNVWFEDCTFGETKLTHYDPRQEFGRNKNVQFHRCEWTDVWRDEPVAVTDDGKWSAHRSRISGIYVNKCDGILFEDCLFDQCGWHPDAHPEGLATHPQPASMFSHGAYIQDDCFDVIAKRNVFRNNASMGLMSRPGVWAKDNLCIGNNVGLQFFAKDNTRINQSVLVGNVVIQAGNNTPLAPSIGAVGWGIHQEGRAEGAILLDNIVTHSGPIHHGSYVGRRAYNPVFDNTIVHKWEGVEDENTGGKDPDLSTLADSFKRDQYRTERDRIMGWVRAAYS